MNIFGISDFQMPTGEHAQDAFNQAIDHELDVLEYRSGHMPEEEAFEKSIITADGILENETLSSNDDFLDAFGTDLLRDLQL